LQDKDGKVYISVTFLDRDGGEGMPPRTREDKEADGGEERHPISETRL
jgi:hypothetical protein